MSCGKPLLLASSSRKLLSDLGILADEFSSTRFDDRGKEQVILELDRDLSLTLAGQYEPRIAYHVAKAFNQQNLNDEPKQEVFGLSETDAKLIRDDVSS